MASHGPFRQVLEVKWRRPERWYLRRLWFVVLCLCLVVPVGCGTHPPTAEQIPTARQRPGTADVEAVADELLELMRQRLLLMHDVARWKWNAGKPITDEQRERELLSDLEERGLALGIDRSTTRSFMAAQIEAGKLVQEADFKRWREQGQGQFANVRDLAIDLRPAIDRLSVELLAHLAQLAPTIDQEDARATIRDLADQILRGEGIDETVRAAALRSWFAVSPS
jgi:chorismate mutase